MTKSEKSNASWYFLLLVVLAYVVLFFISIDAFFQASNSFLNILKTILPVFFVAFVLMTLMNYFITREMIAKHLGNKSWKGWFFAIVSGIISMGPIYMWYPLLDDAREKGVSNGIISCFLYNRAIKLPLLPIILIYFSIEYVFILVFVMIFVSVIQGIFINKIIR